MRNTTALLIVGIVLALAGQAIAAEREDALEILGKAIKAHGGEDALNKAAQLTRKGSGTITLFDKDLPFTDELTLALPDRLRFTLEVTVDKQKPRITQVLSGDSGWQDDGGAVTEIDKERLAELQTEIYVKWVSLLVPLKKNEFQLAPLPSAKINGRAAIGIKVAHKGRADISLYFDQDNGLLVKASRKGKEAGVDVLKDYLFSDYKDVDGVKLPFRTIEMLNDKKYTDLNVAGYKLGKPDDKLFGKP